MAELLTARLAYRPQNGGYATTGGLGQCLGSLLNLETVPLWVRLIFFNDLREPWVLNGAAVAPTASVGDAMQPVDADGSVDGGLWRRVTFNAGGADTEPLGPPAAPQYRLVLPGNPGPPGQPVRLFSDWIPVPPVPRGDGGFGSLLLVRSFAEGLPRVSGSGPDLDPAIRRDFAGFWAGGDGTAPPWTYHGNPIPGWHACYGVQYIAAVPGATVLALGDSIMHAPLSTGQQSGFAVRACTVVSTQARPVSFFNEGHTGRNSADYCAAGQWDIAHLRPQVVLIQCWSENDGPTREAADLGFARAMALAEFALRHDCVPVLVTAAPVAKGNVEAESHRQRNLAQVRDAARHGYDLLDLDALWGTGATPNAYRPEFDGGDRTHQNDAGCIVAADALAPILLKILGK